MIDNFEYLVLTVIDADLSKSSRELQHFVNDLGVWHTNEGTFNTGNIYHSAPPHGGAHMEKLMLWQPYSLPAATAVLVNYTDGLHTLIYSYCKKFKHKAVMIRLTAPKVTHQMFSLSYFDFSGDNFTERNIQLLKDCNQWLFTTTGTEMYFEDVTAYGNKKAADRFGKTMMLAYLKRIGWDIAAPGFWQTTNDAVYLERIEW